MKLSEIAIKNHVFTWMVMAALLIFGGLAFERMGVSQLPDVDYPNLNIRATWDGASPEIIEMTAIDLIEGAITSIPGVSSISSTARAGSANISVEFDLDKDIDQAVQDVQSALNRIQRQLPSGMELPTIQKTNPEDDPIIWLSVSSKTRSRTELMKVVQDQIRDRFTTLQGVGEISLSGFLTPYLRVLIAKEKLEHFQLTPSDIIETIQREHSERPGGRIENTEKEINVRTLGEAMTVEDFGQIAITKRGGALNYLPVPLKEVATLVDGTADPRSLTRAQGQLAVGIGIKKQPGSNAVDVAHRVKDRVNELKLQIPKDIDLDVRVDSTKFIEEAVDELNFTLLFSALLTALVCWLFLGSWTATVNVVMAIPTSVVGTFIVLQFLGFTLNTFTLLGLSLAIGIVVDDAIMVLENIVRHLERGRERRQSALEGSAEITMAAIAATAAIIAIFMPVAFMKGVIGKYFFQFGLTLSVAVFLSLLEALTLTPMRCSRYLSLEPRTTWVGKGIEALFRKGETYYRNLIAKALNRPGLVLSLSLFVLGVTVVLGSHLKQEFVPAQDQSLLSLRVQMPVGTSLTMADQKFIEIEKYLSQQKEVKSYFSMIGSPQVNGGMISVVLKPRNERSMSAQDLAILIRKDLKSIKGTRITVSDPSLALLGGRRSSPVAFSVRGPDWDQLIYLANKIMKEMETSNLMVDIDSNFKMGMPEIQVHPDRIRAREYGVNVSDISEIINTMVASSVAGQFSQGGKRYSVLVGLPPENRTQKDIIRSLQVRNNRGELVPLSKVVRLDEVSTLQSITREDRQRAITITANVAKGSSQAEALERVQSIASSTLTQGYSVQFGGSAKTFKESFSGLIFAIVMGLIVAYMILASQFNSFIHPITILVALPFSISGAFVALVLTKNTLNIYSFIGLILLMGIVKKNSILLVEFANHWREKGHSAKDSLIEACPQRLRPILMTSIATIVGALPSALSFGPGSESRVPMAVAIIGGVFVSTGLTLVVVPNVYLLLDRFTEKEI